MSRPLGSQLATDIGQAGAIKAELIELQFGDPVTKTQWARITTAADDLLVQPPGYTAAVVWSGIGGVIDYGALAETTDPSGQSVTLAVSGVEQSIISLLMGQQYLGRMCRIWYLHLNPATGAVMSDPLEMFRGWMNGGWTIEEERALPTGTVKVSCKIGTWMSGHRSRQGIFCNVHSHQLKAPGDTFFKNVPSLVNRKFYWGQATPQDTSSWGPTGPVIPPGQPPKGWGPFGPF